MLILYSQVHGDPGGRWQETLIKTQVSRLGTQRFSYHFLRNSAVHAPFYSYSTQLAKKAFLTIVSGNFFSSLEPPKCVLRVTMSMYVTFLRWLWLCGGTGPGGGAVAETGAVHICLKLLDFANLRNLTK